MGNGPWMNVLLVVLFVLIGGVFAATELALVSLREGQLQQMEKEGGRAAHTARLARDPNRFLAAVQIGVTVAGFFSAAYGASTLAPAVTPFFVSIGMRPGAASTTAFITLTLIIVYLSLVLGELVPKRLALQHTRRIAQVVGPPLDYFSRLMRPVVWLLSVSTNGVVRLLGGDPHARGGEMSEEELRGIIIGHEGLTLEERRILADVLDADGRSLAEVMTPRADVVFLQEDMTVEEALDVLGDFTYSRYPVIGKNFDDILGFLHVRDLLRASENSRIRDFTREILLLPNTNHLLPSMSHMRREGVHIAIVVDEYGGTDGIATLEDLVEELIGDIRDEYDAVASEYARTSNGIILVSASVTIEEFAEETGIELEDGSYETAGGYVLDRLNRLAKTGDEVKVEEALIRVAAVKGRRIITLEVHPEVAKE